MYDNYAIKLSLVLICGTHAQTLMSLTNNSKWPLCAREKTVAVKLNMIIFGLGWTRNRNEMISSFVVMMTAPQPVLKAIIWME